MKTFICSAKINGDCVLIVKAKNKDEAIKKLMQSEWKKEDESLSYCIELENVEEEE